MDEKIIEEIMAELKYHRKLLEDILMRLDESRHSARQNKQSATAAMDMLINNPMLKAHPAMHEALGNALRNAGLSKGGN